MSAFFAADTKSLTVTGTDLAPGSAVSVLLAGRRIWTFRVPEEGSGWDGVTIEWPPALAERLRGRARLAVERDGTLIGGEQPVQFDESDTELLLCEPATGIPLVVNKWGRIARSFEGREASLVEGVLDEAERLIELVRDRAGIELFVTGGTLLGPVRDGRILPSDDDADLAYLSRHENPSDVALESYELERMLVAEGHEVVRHSSGHLQLMYPGGTVTDRFYLDIFTYFVCSGWFHGTFHARERADEVTVLPLKPVDVSGRMLPGPAEPDSMLTAIYGPGWRTPDPAFRFVTPPSAGRRFYWWLNHFDVDRENWEDHHRAEISADPSPPPSAFALATAGRLAPGSSVLDLGCGLGADARYFAAQGHSVLGVDYSRPALVFARAAGDEGGRLRFEHTNLYMARHAMRLRRQCKELPGPVQVYGNQLFNALSPLGWDTTLQLVKHLLAEPGARAHFEVGVGGEVGSLSWLEYRPVEWRRFEEQLARYGMEIDERADVPLSESAGAEVRRVIVRRMES
ncbi:methyltransferase domain-containing protein [Arthrobacter sp. MSA 4-2]|uniref:class I SAM-dependent methyltransferase n=1 Tax=Arthrobacter sp. MSA 4-2 TaxID=2794349 RepID=UPI0018E6FEB0|nr:class I SAM-dependent methyltransferase [Arthrobacter sp. MSA 4-2]MBJ2120842.1 methyltransferase domain-containing protein [Arthrobacter sp. MSA 4-2]